MNLLSENISDYLENYSKKIGKPVLYPELIDRITKLKETIEWLSHYDEYYAIINLKELCIDWNYGFKEYIGYSDEEIKKNGIAGLTKLVHPFVRQWDIMYAMGLFDMFMQEKPQKKARLRARYIINLPIRRKDNTYILVKQMSLPLVYDNENRLTSYLCVYTIVNDYKGQSLRPRFFEKAIRQRLVEKNIISNALKYVKVDPKINFTEKEFKLIDLFFQYEQNNDKEKWQPIVAKKLGVTENRIGKKATDINYKIKNLFKSFIHSHHEGNLSDNFYSCMPLFNSFEKSVRFIYKSGILTILKCKFNNSKNLDHIKTF